MAELAVEDWIFIATIASIAVVVVILLVSWRRARSIRIVDRSDD